MAVNIQNRSGKFQLRVTHKLLPKPFFFTFLSQDEAQTYGDQLMALLARGVVPQEMLVKPKSEADPMLTVVMENYQRQTSITDSDEELFKILKMEMIGVRVSGVTFTWAENYVRTLKAPDKHLAPSTIRKRVGALGRVVDWHIRQTTKDDEAPRANPLRMLTRGYSVYSKEDAKLVEPKVDQSRDRRLAPDELQRVLNALAGVKREDRERPFTNDEAFGLMFALIVDTGMRLFEAYRMRADMIDFKTNIIRVDGSKGHRGLIKPRVVPIKKELRAPLTAWCDGRVGLLFPYWDGTPEARKKTQGRLTQRFMGLFDYAEVPDFTEHDLRHEAACRWFELRNERGWVFSEIEVCRIMGWTDTRMALRYASLRGEDLSSRLG
ncbi:MAG: site-specific integrase [Rhodoferax sp.]|nr:site-specific integrase [Rhodoferax sp.]MDP3654283.1 site-specific integrase [Rhodoferax sp.]